VVVRAGLCIGMNRNGAGHSFCAPAVAVVIAAARFMPAVCGVFGSRSQAWTTRIPSCFQRSSLILVVRPEGRRLFRSEFAPMKVAYVDMIAALRRHADGAWVDAGVDVRELERALRSVVAEGWELVTERVERGDQRDLPRSRHSRRRRSRAYCGWRAWRARHHAIG